MHKSHRDNYWPLAISPIISRSDNIVGIANKTTHFVVVFVLIRALLTSFT